MQRAIDDAVLQAVPHRAPILRVHRILLRSRDRVRAAGCEPTGPGALPWAAGAIEGMAQTAALLALPADAGPGGSAPQGMLVAVKKFRIHATPPPDAEIEYTVELVRRFGPTALLRGIAECNGLNCASGELTLWSRVP
ncbi:MAG: hypothetical protein JNK15_23610 [Planctomycetes bacterium]|nr:hypothetical protein [Planctomycetota bacterium]